MKFYFLFPSLLLLLSCTKKNVPVACTHQNYLIKDSVVYIIDTVYVHHYVDTVYTKKQPTTEEQHTKMQKGKIRINTNNLGIGPSFGAYYSPFHGYDLIFGFGVQYFFTSIPLGKTRGRHPMWHRSPHSHK